MQELEGILPIKDKGELVAIVYTLPDENRRQVFYKVSECKQSDIKQLLDIIAEGNK